MIEKEEKEEETPPGEEQEEDVTDRLSALENSVEKLTDMVLGFVSSKTPDKKEETPTHEKKKPESPVVDINSPFEFIFVRKRGGRVVKRAVPKTEKKKEESA